VVPPTAVRTLGFFGMACRASLAALRASLYLCTARYDSTSPLYECMSFCRLFACDHGGGTIHNRRGVSLPQVRHDEVGGFGDPLPIPLDPFSQDGFSFLFFFGNSASRAGCRAGLGVSAGPAHTNEPLSHSAMMQQHRRSVPHYLVGAALSIPHVPPTLGRGSH
jgi:hypothetical protein